MKTLAFAVVLLAASAVALAEDDELEIYDVSTITAPRTAQSGPFLGLLGSGHHPQETPSLGGTTPFMEVDAIADVIRETISPATWDEGGDVLGQEGGRLLVKAPPDVQRMIADLLDVLRAAAARRVQFSVEVLDLPADGYYDTFSRGVPGDYVTPKGSLLESVSGEAYPGVRTALKVTNRVRYVQDYDVEIAQGSMLTDPIVLAAEEGLTVDLVPHPTSDGSRIFVESLVQQGRIDQPIRTATLALDEEYFAEPFRSSDRRYNGRVQLPVFHHVDAYTTHVVSPGEIFAIPIASGDRVKVFLVSTRLLGGTNAGPIAEIGSLTHRPQIQTMGFPWESDYPMELHAPRIYWENPKVIRRTFGGAEEIMDLIQNLVEPESWEEGDAVMNVFGSDRLYVVAQPAVREKLDRFVRRLEVQELRPVRLDLRVYSVPNAVPPGARRSFEVEDSRLLFAGTVATIAGRSTSLMAGSTMNYIADYDVEVAQEARIADPTIGQSFDGLVANLTPRLGKDAVRLDVELLVSRRSWGGEYDLDAQFLGPVDSLAERRSVLNTTVEIPAGHVYVLDSGPDPESATRRMAVVIGTKVD